MTTLTIDQESAIRAYLDADDGHGGKRHISKGLGTPETTCSVGALNVALTGNLTDEVPYCMSAVIGQWIIVIQDAMSDAMRNSDAWRNLLPRAAGTGRDHEAARLALIMDWMWRDVLPTVQPVADEGGFGAEWKRMTDERTRNAAIEAWAASASASASSAALASATLASAMAADTATSAALASAASTAAAEVAEAAAMASAAAADAAAMASAAAAEAATSMAGDAPPTGWLTFDPCGLLARLIAVS